MRTKTFKHKKTGGIATYKDGVLTSNNCSVEIGVEPSLEYWDEVVEKEYEILSFINTEDEIFIKDSKDVYRSVYDNKYNGFGNWRTLEYILQRATSCQIYSVKRLSDGEIFTVGDRAKTIGKYPHTIASIEIKKKHKESVDRIWLNWEKDSGGNWIEAVEKCNKITVSTEDGEDLEIGDTLYVPQKKGDKFSGSILDFKITDSYKPDGSVVFAHKENAKKFVGLHKPAYSLKDVEDTLETVTNLSNDIIIDVIEHLGLYYGRNLE